MANNPNQELDQELELDLFVDPPDEEYKCGICLCILTDPQQLSVCQHMFCKKCITKHFQSVPEKNFCPMDRRLAFVTDIMAAPRPIINVISRFRMKCFYSAQGCPTIDTVENIRRHAGFCRFRSFNILVIMVSPAKKMNVTVTGKDTVRSIKLRIQEKVGIDTKYMVLNFKTKTLKDTQTLFECGIKDSDLLWLSRRFLGA